MPFVLRFVDRVMAKSWRLPAGVLIVAITIGWLLIQICEPHDSKLRNPSAYLWFVFVSGTTTGYGDLTPVTTGGRLGAVIIMVSGLTAGLVLLAQLTVVMGQRRTMKLTGLARLHHRRHLIIIGYERSRVRDILDQLRADTRYATTPVVVVFHREQLTEENPDPASYDVVLFDETAFQRACLEEAATVYVDGRSDDETVRMLVEVSAMAPDTLHVIAGVRTDETHRAVRLIDPNIEIVHRGDPVVVADVIQNPGVAAIYSKLASNLDGGASLYRVNVPEGTGEWSRLELAVHLLRMGCTLLAVGESHRPNAHFRLVATTGETVRGGQSLAVVAPWLPDIDWSRVPHGETASSVP